MFIDARKMGRLIDRVHRELTAEDIDKIAFTYHNWRVDLARLIEEAEKNHVTVDPFPPYQDTPGFSKSASREEIRAHGYVLTPGRYVGAEDVEDDDEPFDEKMRRLTDKLAEQFSESATLEIAIRENLKSLGFGEKE